MRTEKNKAIRLKCESYADKAIAFMPEEAKTKLLRSFVASLFLVRAAKEESRLKDNEGWTSEFEGAHDVLVEIADDAGVVVDYTCNGKAGLELEFVPEEGEGGADE